MYRPLKILFLLLLILSRSEQCFSFQQNVIEGTVTDSTGNAIEKVSVVIRNTSVGTFTDKAGKFSLRLPEKTVGTLLIDFSSIGFTSRTVEYLPGRSGDFKKIILSQETTRIGEVRITAERSNPSTNTVPVPVTESANLPSVSGGIEGILKTFPGISSRNELSNQYSVRGGSFAENLVYVNDEEIFRPFLIRSGEQEGLSFINPDLVQSVSFSSGGFSASFGDKLSSVLDIRYRKPAKNRYSAAAGLLLNSVHAEGISANGKLSWLAGARYKQTGLMLKTLDSKGDYQPVFVDIQSVINYKTGRNSELSLMLSYASNTFNYIPQSRRSTFGTETNAYQLFVLFEGREKDKYRTVNGALTWTYSNNNKSTHKLTASVFSSNESETFDIRGFYTLHTLDKVSGSENFSDSIMNIGIGSFLSHARNRLMATIFTAGYRGEKNSGPISIQWGLTGRGELFDYHLREWKMIDSAGYSVPVNYEGLRVFSFINGGERTLNYQVTAFSELAGKISTGIGKISFNGGLRFLYNSFTNEWILSPRFSSSLRYNKKLLFRASAGLYVQPPFFREMWLADGSINRNIKSQKSYHAIATAIYDFTAWGRPFRLTGEIYNKFLSDIIPYKVDNVRIIFDGENSATGYARGIECRLNGEFVEGAESWISLSIMDSKLRIKSLTDDKFPAPNDQTFSTNIFFQDYLPGYPAWRVHLNLAFSTGIPVVSPFNNRYDQYRRLPAYRRVDLGITRVIIGFDSRGKHLGNSSFFREIIAGLEIFNLLDINNTVSYFWVKSISNLDGDSRQYAIPDYLTGRSLNLRISAKF